MREYETTFVFQPEISEEGRQAVFERLDAVLEKNGGTRLLYDDWGKRRLAYEIEKFQKGHYVMLSYLDGGVSVPELERTLRLDESILRFLTILVAESVKDIEARKAKAAEDERIQAERAAERAAREAEEQRAREERAREEAERLATEQAEADKAAAAREEASAEGEAQAPSTEGEGEVAESDETDATDAAEPTDEADATSKGE